jgi:TIR domain
MAEQSERRDKRLKVFVSYARDDLEFADQLVSALEAFDFDLLIDREGISAGEDWQRRLGALIAEADTVVFLLSPSAAQSEMCAWEIAETDRLSKRLFPVVIKPLGATPVPERFQELNYIFFYSEPRVPGSGFGRGLHALVQALNTDLDWVREYTRLGQRASEWQTGGQSENRLLSGGDIAAAKDWLARRPAKASAPTPLHLDFIRASEDAQTARESAERRRLDEVAAVQAARERAQNEREAALRQLRRRTLTWGTAALLLALAAGTFGGLAELQRRNADTQSELAKEHRLAAEEQTRIARANESRALAALSEVAFEQNRYIDAVKLAIAAWPRDRDDNRPKLVATVKALSHAQRLQRQTIPPLRHEDEVWGAVFNRDESRILTWSDDGTARLWDAATGEELLSLRRTDDVFGVSGAAFNRDESHILTWSDHGTRLWDAATGKELLSLGDGHGAAFSDDGIRVLTRSYDSTRLWDAATGQELLSLHHEGAGPGGVRGAAFNNDETRILTWSVDDTARLWDISRLPRGHLIDLACGMLPDSDDPDTPEFEYPDASELKDRYGIAIAEPICGPDTPAPVWTELVD